MLASLGAIKCRFGRVGETIAVFLNTTHVKCVTPSMIEAPEDVHRETVVFSLSMNGMTFDDDTSSLEYTFVGTGNLIGLKGIVIAILLLAPCAAGFIYFSQSAAMSFSFQPPAVGNNSRGRPSVAIFGNENQH